MRRPVGDAPLCRAELRPARREDLPLLNRVYEAVIRHMEQKGLRVWDEVYPCCCFPEDAAAGRLYLLWEGTKIIGAFALCEAAAGAERVRWSEPSGKAVYLERFAVAPACLGKGVGTRLFQEAAALARTMGARFLRLFVVDFNEPAIRFYLKNGVQRAAGEYRLELPDGPALRELAMELELS